MGYPERLLGPDERLVLTLRPHVKALLRPLLVLLATAPATGYAIGMVSDGDQSGWMRAALAALAALVVGRWVVAPFLVWFHTLYVITDRRLVTRHGVLRRTGHDLPLTRLNDVEFFQHVLDRVLGCGSLVVESAAQAGRLELADVPRVEQMQRTLYRLSDDARRHAPGRGPVDEDDGASFDDLVALEEGPDETAEPDEVGDGLVPRAVERATLVLGRRRERGRQ